jgi:GT2 family glycosyltransferase
MKKYKITAAVPCYNAEKYIDRCIMSLEEQNIKPDEIIVVNDGSTDNSENLIKSHDNVKLINHPENFGLAIARNTAIKSASGDIIVFIDSDAKAHVDLIEKLLECYSEDKIAGVGGEALEGINNTIFDIWRSYHAYQGQKEKKVKIVDMVAGVCSSYRRSIFEEIGLFDTVFKTNAEDMEFGLRLKSKGYKIIYTPFAKVDHLRTDNLRSLSRMIFNWYYYGFIARKRVLGNAVSWYLYVITKHGLRNVCQDIFYYKSFELAVISIIMTLVEYSSVIKNIFKSLKN